MSSRYLDRGAGPPAAPGADNNGSKLNTGAIITVASIVVLFVVFACGLSSIYCCINSLDRRLRGGGAASSSPARTRGVDPELLRSLPVTVYHRAEAAKDSSSVECAVCLAELEDGEAARFLPRCGHGFHAECVDKWLASHTTCPLCRLAVAKPDDHASPPGLAPVQRELANYGSNSNNLPSAGAAVADRGATTAVQLVIEIPDSAPRDAAKSSPGLARLRSIRRLWSFGRQGAGPSSSCSCPGEGADVSYSAGVQRHRRYYLRGGCGRCSPPRSRHITTPERENADRERLLYFL
ncbi:hypothetical protein PR202_gb08831 [Eleusine coracana subsp. coracana]|uniref:RING-type E3 ubiquitin transferase n=1 Tax=Eleusine coracana subsp. coracana TaxID=191504 RepID=A0AAV5EET3_ELECO|nr:hypothetical protein PR202_gb08831 [Eleusine coracana subsp. coracana]